MLMLKNLCLSKDHGFESPCLHLSMNIGASLPIRYLLLGPTYSGCFGWDRIDAIVQAGIELTRLTVMLPLRTIIVFQVI